MPNTLKTFDKMPNYIEDRTVNYNVTEHICGYPKLTWPSKSTVLMVLNYKAKT